MLLLNAQLELELHDGTRATWTKATMLSESAKALGPVGAAQKLTQFSSLRRKQKVSPKQIALLYSVSLYLASFRLPFLLQAPRASSSLEKESTGVGPSAHPRRKEGRWSTSHRSTYVFLEQSIEQAVRGDL